MARYRGRIFGVRGVDRHRHRDFGIDPTSGDASRQVEAVMRTGGEDASEGGHHNHLVQRGSKSCTCAQTRLVVVYGTRRDNGVDEDGKTEEGKTTYAGVRHDQVLRYVSRLTKLTLTEQSKGKLNDRVAE